MDKKEATLREIRKLIDILNTWGNVLVPYGAEEGPKQINAVDKLKSLVNFLTEEENLTLEEIEEQLLTLDN